MLVLQIVLRALSILPGALYQIGGTPPFTCIIIKLKSGKIGRNFAMKVFISWSGAHAKEVAELLQSHLEDVNQRVAAFVSSQSIEAGSVWFDIIMSELQETGYGIACVTKSHLDKPWLLFESGAMAAKFGVKGVVPLLVDASNGDLIYSPLKHFNSVVLAKDQIHKIHQSINTRMGNAKMENLEPQKLDKHFERSWPEFEAACKAINTSEEPIGPSDQQISAQRRNDDVLDEILGLVRKIDRTLPSSSEASRLFASRPSGPGLAGLAGFAKPQGQPGAGNDADEEI